MKPGKKWGRVAKMLGYRLRVATRPKSDHKGAHAGLRWRVVATGVLLVLSVHTLAANLLLPALTQQLADARAPRLSVRIEEQTVAEATGLAGLGMAGAGLFHPAGITQQLAGLGGGTGALLPAEELLEQGEYDEEAEDEAAAAVVAAGWQQDAGGSSSSSSSGGSPAGSTAGGSGGLGSPALAAAWTAAAAEEGSGGSAGAWLPARRGLAQGQLGPSLPPSSLARWLCGEGSPEQQRRSRVGYRHNLVMKGKEYVKAFGGAVPRAKWCRGEVPWLVPQLRKVVLLESSKPRASQGVTIVTQLSLERLGMLEEQCRLWPHPISAVVYVPLLLGRIFSAEETGWNQTNLDEGIAQALRFHAAMEALPGGCALDLELVSEERCTAEQAVLYPINAARNRALRNVKTEAVLLLDVDFAVSQSLSSILGDAQQYGQLIHTLRQRTALVLPAFETRDGGRAGRQLALEAVVQGKAYVAEQYTQHKLFGFHTNKYPQAHSPTSFDHWLGHDRTYRVVYKAGFEPYVLMATELLPWWDERSRGYYWNNVQHFLHIATQLNTTFEVHPSAFVVHVPHAKPHTKGLAQRLGQKDANYKMFKKSLLEMRKGRFVPVTAFPQECLGEESSRIK